jgi:hypothetical protein
MRNWKTTLPVALSAVAAIIMFAQPDKASAAPVQEPVARPAALTLTTGSNPDGSLAITTAVSAGTQDVVPLVSYTLNRTVTAQLWAAWAVGGAPALVGLCGLLGPVLRAICAPVMAVIAAYFDQAGSPRGRCLQVSTRVGWPPATARYVTCP